MASSSSNISREIKISAIEKTEDYMPASFLDRYGNTAQRVYTHANCKKSVSYAALQHARVFNDNNCPMCLSKGLHVNATNMIPNEGLSNSISNFVQNFNLRNDAGIKSSYDLARDLFKEEHFGYVAGICKRALGFESRDPELHKNLQSLLERAGELFSHQNKPFVPPENDNCKFSNERDIQSQLDIKKKLEKIQSLENELKNCLEGLESSDNDIEKKYLKDFVEMYYRNIAVEKNIIARIYVESKLPQKAIDAFEEASRLYIQAIEQDVTNLAEKKTMRLDLASNVTNLGDFYVSLERFTIAIENYEKAIEYLKSAIDLCENKSDFKNKLEFGLDKIFLKLSKAYLFLADEVSEGKYKKSKEYLEKAQKTLDHIKEKDEEIKRLLENISEKIISAELNLKIADLIERIKKK